MKRIYSFIVLGLLFIILLIAGCNSAGESTSIKSEKENVTVPPSPYTESPPSTPIQIELTMSTAPPLNIPANLTCTLTLREGFSVAENITAEIKLPDNVTLISGNLIWQGDLQPGEPVSFSPVIYFNEIGHFTITAAAGDDLDYIYLDIGKEHSQFGWLPEPAKVIRIDKYSVIQTDLQISHAPKLNEPANISITILSPVDFSGLDVIVFFPKTAVISDSNSLLSIVPQVPEAANNAMQVTGVDLVANTPFEFSATIIFKETGYYKIVAGAFHKVDDISYTCLQDSIYLKIGVNESTFEQEPQKEVHPTENLPPPPPTWIEPSNSP